jgi:hypothetical protein
MQFPFLDHPARWSSHRRRRLCFVSVSVVVAVAVFAATATADVTSSFMGTWCPSVRSGQVFLPWLDPASYELAPNGGFEDRAKDWSLSGDAHVIAGNESFHVHDSKDKYALELPDGSSALSSPVCIGLARPTFRFFASNSGAPTSLLNVQVIYRGLLGAVGVLDGGTIIADSVWTPTVQMLMLEVPSGATSVQIKFTPVGSGGNWRIDDLYIDPFNSV